MAASQLVLLLFLSVLERRELPAAVITALYALLPLIPGLLLTGVVLSLKGLRQASRQKGKGRFQALIGLLLGSYLLLIEVFMLAFFTAWGMGIIRK